MSLNLRIIVNIMGLLIGLNGMFMLLCIPVCLAYDDGDLNGILISGLLTAGAGGAAWFFSRKAKPQIRKREGYLIVALGWLMLSLTGTLPYLLTESLPNFAEALFETASGYTTTGASVMNDIEAMPHGVLFWRSITHWIGGMGIIVLALAILPILGIGGMQLFSAESPGPSTDKLHPRIQETAKRLWLLYVSLTILETILLWVGGMTFYDALNHSMSTVSTGGFSTKNLSVAYYDAPFIQYIIILFMILSGINFSLTYFALRGNFRKIWKNEEFKTFLGVVGIAVLLTTLIVWLQTPTGEAYGLERSFRDSLFQVVAVVTTTGFVTADFTAWTPLLTVFFFILMFTGGSAGSTSGGVKMIRHIVIFRNGLTEFRRLLHPSGVIPVRYNGKSVNPQIVQNILAFLVIYLFVFAVGAFLLGAIGLDFLTAIGASAASVGNIGPGLGGVGPVENYSLIPDGGKIILVFEMIIGRLELFTILILFTPYFWRRS